MGAVDTTYTFTATDTITSTKMNNIIDQTTITSDAITGTTLDVSGGKLKIRTGGITSNEMGANSVLSASIKDGDVTTAKLADESVTTDKVANASITLAKLSQPPIISGTPVSASGSVTSFSSIPSWITSITILFDSISTLADATITVRVGSGGSLATSGYLSYIGYIDEGANADTFATTIGTTLLSGESADKRFGAITFIKLGTGNKWVINGTSSTQGVGSVAKDYVCMHSGVVTLSGQLDIIGIQCLTSSFDDGTVNVIYQ